jgi:translation initiation factor 2B subunit (eIF-2B alpha/beta/delta family)
MEPVSEQVQKTAEQRLGAAQVTERAADVLLRRSQAGAAPSPEGFRQEMFETGWSLIKAQVALAPLINLVNEMMWRLEQHEDLTGLRHAVSETVVDFKRRLKHHATRVAEASLPLIPDNSRVVTISNSSTIQRALIYAQRAGRRFEVLCAESRPGCEGRQTAAILAGHGIPVTLIIDAAAMYMVRTAQTLLIGADLLSNRGLVNKIGTRPLAMIANAANVSVHALCGSEKFLPTGYPFPAQSDWPPEEVWEHLTPGVKIHNYYFDITPLNEISSIVTEEGILPAPMIEGWLAATKLHPILEERATQEAVKWREFLLT